MTHVFTNTWHTLDWDISPNSPAWKSRFFSSTNNSNCRFPMMPLSNKKMIKKALIPSWMWPRYFIPLAWHQSDVPDAAHCYENTPQFLILLSLGLNSSDFRRDSMCSSFHKSMFHSLAHVQSFLTAFVCGWNGQVLVTEHRVGGDQNRRCLQVPTAETISLWPELGPVQHLYGQPFALVMAALQIISSLWFRAQATKIRVIFVVSSRSVSPGASEKRVHWRGRPWWCQWRRKQNERLFRTADQHFHVVSKLFTVFFSVN